MQTHAINCIRQSLDSFFILNITEINQIIFSETFNEHKRETEGPVWTVLPKFQLHRTLSPQGPNFSRNRKVSVVFAESSVHVDSCQLGALGGSYRDLLGKTDQKGTDHCFRSIWPQANEDYMFSIPCAPVLGFHLESLSLLLGRMDSEQRRGCQKQ